MNIKFSKYQGTGNDFIIINNLEKKHNLSENQISHLCHRHFGIGADGLIFLLPSSGFDFKMLYYNADGKEGTMCGNGGRCIAAFAHKIGHINNKAAFEAIDGIHSAEIVNIRGRVTDVKLGLNDVKAMDVEENYYFLNTGSPHYIEFIKNPDVKDIYSEGKKIRCDKRFQPEGTNVNFVTLFDDSIYVQTFERGVENVTLSCGTGITASAIASSFKNPKFLHGVYVKTKGGNLKVEFDKKDSFFTNIYLIGPAELSFSGQIEI